MGRRTIEQSAEEKDICLNCPLPKCKQKKWGTCDRFRAEMEKIIEAHRKEKKRDENNK